MTKVLFSILFIIQFQGFCQPQVFGVAGNGDLYLLNLNNCSKALVGATGRSFEDIALTPNGKLWGIDDGSLYKINTTAATVTFVAQSVPTSYTCTSLVAVNDSILLTSSINSLPPAPYVLYVINANSGISYSTGVIGYQTKGDLNWYDNDLYLTSDKLIKITLNANLSISNVQAVGANNIPVCYGAVSATLAGANNYIAGAGSDGNIYKICPFDGSYSILCPNLTAFPFNGLDANRLPIQNPLPTSCLTTTTNTVTTGIENLRVDSKKIQIYPNPGNKNESISIKLNYYSGDPLDIQLLNLQGQVLFSRRELVSEDGFELNLKNEELSTGVYMVSVASSSGIFHSLVLIE